MTNKIDDTLKERGSRYGSFEDNAEITQCLMEVVEKAPNYHKLSRQHKEAIHMIFHKVARCVCGDPDYTDNFHDAAGYSKLLEEFLIKKELTSKSFENQMKEDFEKQVNDEVTMLIHAFQGKFGDIIELQVSQTALLKFREKLRNGEI